MKGFKDLESAYVDTITKIMNEEMSEYDKVFHAAMKKFNISSPDELGSDDKKKEFFNYVDSQYTAKDESYADDYKKFAAQHPEQDMTESTLDRHQFHTSLGKAKFMVRTDTVKKSTKKYLHDLENETYAGKPMVVTFTDIKLAKDAAKKFGGEIEKTPLGTFRISLKESNKNDTTEQDMTEGEDWRDENEYGDAAEKAAMKEGKFYEKKFPTKKHKIIDNADINSIIDRRHPSPTYNEATKEEKQLSERAEDKEEMADAEPVSQSGLDVANAEPNSAVGFRNDPIPPKRVDVLCDIDRSDPNNPKRSYRLWCQYPTGQVSIHPAPNEPGMEFVEDLALLDIPNSAEAIASALDVPKSRPAHKGVNEAVKSASGYSVYHSSFSGAVKEVLDFVKRKGFEVNDDEYFNEVSTGPKKPSPGKTNKYHLSLYDKTGNKIKKMLHFQVYGMDDNRYELNAYIS